MKYTYTAADVYVLQTGADGVPTTICQCFGATTESARALASLLVNMLNTLETLSNTLVPLLRAMFDDERIRDTYGEELNQIFDALGIQ